jgi:hypothetical protein
MNNKVVARFVDGRVVKGTTVDFNPGKEVFHVIEADAPIGAQAMEIKTRQLKALFFVKDLVGNPNRAKGDDVAAPLPALGRKVRVVFADGEVLEGTTAAYHPGRPGFFLEPMDPDANEQRLYVVTASANEITLL